MDISRLAQFVREWREKHKLTQEDLQRQLGIELIQYVHKLEKGKIRKPSPDFLRSFSSLSGRSIPELRSMSTQPAIEEREVAAPSNRSREIPDEQRDPDRYQVAFGHAIWAAPLALAAMRGELNDRFQFSSFAHADGGAIDITATNREDGYSDLRDRLIWTSRATLSNCPGSQISNVETLSAREVRQLLTRRKVDVIAAPGEMLLGQRSVLRIATIVDSALGCVFVHRSKLLSGRSMTTEQVAIGIRKHQQDFTHDNLVAGDSFTPEETELLEMSGGRALCIAGEDETVAAVYGDEIATHLYLGDPPEVRTQFRVKIDTGYVNNSSLSTLRADLLQKKRVLLGVVLWEPQASWLQSGTNWQRLLLQRTPDNRPPEHLTFEVAILETTAADAEFRRAFDRLLTELFSSFEEVERLREPTADRQTIWWLARYFGYTPANTADQMLPEEQERLLNAISEVRYHVGVDLLNYRRITAENRFSR